MRRYRAAVIGLGRIGSRFEDDPRRVHPCTHAGALAAMGNVELAAGAARSEGSAAEFQRRWNTKAVYTDYRAMIEKERIDIVGVATNPETHSEIVKNIAGLGVKGILCEKPIALSLKDADEMMESCDKNGVVLMTMHNRRWNSLYRSAKELLQKGAIGTVNSIVGICQGCKPNKNWQSDFEGPLLHDATHLFDILRYLFGDVEWITGDLERASLGDRVEDSAYSLMKFRNGIYATTLVNERTDYMRFELEIQASKGKLVLQTNEAFLWKYDQSKYASGFKELAQVEYPMAKKPLNAYLEAYKELISCVETKGKENSSTAKDGRAALEIIMAIYESKRRDSAKVFLPLPGAPSSLDAAIREGAF